MRLRICYYGTVVSESLIFWIFLTRWLVYLNPYGLYYVHLIDPARSCHKRRMTNQSEFPNALSADQFEQMFPNDEAGVEDLFRRGPDGFVCPDRPREQKRDPSSSVPIILQLRSGTLRLGFRFHPPLAKPEA